MAVYIGVDLHVRTETVCWMNTADGEIHQHTLDHSRDDLRAFYAQFTAPAVVGIESSGYALWFHQLMEQAGHRLLVGDAYAIRQFARRRQKNDRRDAELLLDLLRREEVPVVHRPAPPPARAGAACPPTPAWACSPPGRWCPRRSRSLASTALAASPPTADWTPASIPAAPPRATATSPSRAPACCGSCWWKRPGAPCNTKKTWDGSSAACGRGRNPMR